MTPAHSTTQTAGARPGGPSAGTAPFLEVHDLTVKFPTDDGVVSAVNGMDFTLERGQTLGIVGESGSGKSVTSQALMGLLKGTSAQVTGTAMFQGKDLVALPESAMRQLRGRNIGMIFQDPLSALHPFYTVGHQIAEAYLVHNKASKKQARAAAVDMLGRVGIPSPDQRYDEYPHHFSGGMRQRAMIAMALICEPELLIADEPTTALDVTVQAQILDLMSELQEETNSALILITHDLGVVAEVCDDVLVMYGGQCVESGPVDDIFYDTRHPYTLGLLNSMPTLTSSSGRLNPIPGQPPSLLDLPKGCIFSARCQYAELAGDGVCVSQRPELRVEDGHGKRCHLSGPQIITIRNSR
ncbi:peptide/nickel transport system ATP-binding protein [Paenarthrobacter nicotinovorans]|uniref:ABC transporter ATP-binding protein n=1 Tax=Micrococcaceae TaxID=1268 RepID=UPI000876D18B|nr:MULTISPECIES: ABC transporter ATP-binding protein [Micrococcaceae]MDR6436796.1 peptide/nickel transport system ATP-binding protein [Paenarthrobacter nicotinovorans]BCW57562.1 dipeptide/oligopeptide/nickel ABC transporter ATP-binding protein [Arthrobacter sp. StoSoilB20]SCZ66602.1 peptide/nickel transport system ATP-binding protein [Arthrobacter sp. UNCCL28]